MRSIAVIIALILCAHLNAQDTTFIHVIHAPGNDRCEAMIQSLNSDFVLCGSTSSFNSLETDVHLMRLDDQLNILWSNHYGQPFSSEKGNDLKEDEEGNIYVSGLTNATGYDALLMKINQEGDLLWSRSYGSNDWDFVNAMTIDLEGNIYLAGSSYGQEAQDSQGWLLKIDSEGELLWERYFGAEGSDEFTDIDFDGGSFLYLSGNFENTAEDGIGSWMLKCNTDGELIWEKFGETWRERALDVCYIDGRCFFYGYRQDEEFEASTLNYRLDSDGNLVGSDYFLNPGTNYFSECERVNDELIICSGRNNNEVNGGYDFLFNSQSWQGFFNEARTTGALEDDICTDVVPAMNGLFYYSGYTESFDAIFEDIMISYSTVNVPPDGSAVVVIEVDDNFITHLPLFEENELSPYPNPCVDELRFLHGPGGAMQLEIFSVSGQFVGFFRADENASFSVKDLAAGAYLYSLSSNGKQIDSGQLLKVNTSP